MTSNSLKSIFRRNFSSPQMLALIVILLFVALVIYFFGKILAPVFLAIGLAYLLNFPMQYLMRKGLARGWSLAIVFTVLIILITILFVYVGPLLIRQLTNLINETPSIVEYIKVKLDIFQQYISPYVPKITVYQIYENIHQYFLKTIDVRIDNIVAILQNVVYVIGNLFLVPFMALLLLVDYSQLKQAVTRYLPERRELASGVFSEFLGQLDNYVKGKVVEFIIMSILSFVAFSFFGLKYNLILSVIIGISVIVPFLGVILATIPLVMVAFFQFDLTSSFFLLLLVHLILQMFDGNLLVPWLFSKANNLRPFTIIVSVLVFGQIWGILGVFLAIPLATLIKAVGNAWLINSELYKEVHEREEELQRHEAEYAKESSSTSSRKIKMLRDKLSKVNSRTSKTKGNNNSKANIPASNQANENISTKPTMTDTTTKPTNKTSDA